MLVEFARMKNEQHTPNKHRTCQNGWTTTPCTDEDTHDSQACRSLAFLIARYTVHLAKVRCDDFAHVSSQDTANIPGKDQRRYQAWIGAQDKFGNTSATLHRGPTDRPGKGGARKQNQTTRRALESQRHYNKIPTTISAIGRQGRSRGRPEVAGHSPYGWVAGGRPGLTAKIGKHQLQDESLNGHESSTRCQIGRYRRCLRCDRGSNRI